MTMRTRSASKREMIEPHRGDKRYVRRTSRGKFGKTVDLGRSLSADRKRLAKIKVPKVKATAATEYLKRPKRLADC
jgi:hypothetical protein